MRGNWKTVALSVLVFASLFVIVRNDSERVGALSYESSSTPVGGIIWENTTWTLESSPYNITATIQIPDNVTLTIEPGVTVISNLGWRQDMFLLNGIIHAHGTADSIITFDGGGDSNFFVGISATKDTFLDLDHCLIKNGLSFFSSDLAQLNLTDSVLENTYEPSGIYPAKHSLIEGNIFKDFCCLSISTGGSYDSSYLEGSVYIRYNLFIGERSFPGYDYYSIVSLGNYGNYTPEPCNLTVEYNSFLKNTKMLKLYPGFDQASMSAPNNYWGTTNTSIIDTKIYDKNDDITCAGFIEYLPLLTEPNPNTPKLLVKANFTYSPSSLYSNIAASFDASSSFGQYSSIANYTWDFGDGTNATSGSPVSTHTYSASGNYNVVLKVTDEFGFTNITTKNLSVIQDNTPPISSHNYDGAWHTSDFTIALSAGDNESGIKEICYRINDGLIQNVSTDGHPFITTERSNNTLEYWSIDNAGNEENHHFLPTIALDKTPPTIVTPLRDPGSDVQPNQLVRISVNVSDSLSGVDSVRLVYFTNRSSIGLEFPIMLNQTSGLYERAILVQEASTLVKYQITAYDRAGNNVTNDNAGEYFVYSVIPEFPSFLILPLFFIATLLAVIIYRRKKERS